MQEFAYTLGRIAVKYIYDNFQSTKHNKKKKMVKKKSKPDNIIF